MTQPAIYTVQSGNSLFSIAHASMVMATSGPSSMTIVIAR